MTVSESGSVSKNLAALPRPLRGGATKSASASPATAAARDSALQRDVALPLKAPGAGVAKSTVASVSTATDKATDKGKSHFLLQLSSFPDRQDADAFAKRFASQNAYVVATEVPGKGTWYRVRVGNYGNLQEATAAKTTFEREHNVIAYVAGGGPAK